MLAAAPSEQDSEHVWKLLRLGGESAGAGIQSRRPVGTFKPSANGRARLLYWPIRVLGPGGALNQMDRRNFQLTFSAVAREEAMHFQPINIYLCLYPKLHNKLHLQS